MTLQITQKFMKNNDCYKAGEKIKVKGLMVHATATPGIMAADWYSRWNKPGIEKCVHGFLDDKGLFQYLPWNHRGWHGGGSSNNTHIGIEWCEPKNLDDKVYFDQIWNNGVETFAMLCKMFNLTEKDILGHYEGHKIGIASNHADPGHWFPKHGKNMDMFRDDVREKLNSSQPQKVDNDSYLHVVVSGDTLSEIANRYNLTVNYLVKLNNIPDPDVIYEGQRLKLKGNVTIEQPKIIVKPTPTVKRIYLSAKEPTWTVYHTNRPPVKANEANIAGVLKPSKFGGLSYEIIGNGAEPHTYIIQTAHFGKVKIYGHPSTGAVIK